MILPSTLTQSLESKSKTISIKEPRHDYEFVRTIWIDCSTYTPTSDGNRWGRTFASVNFLRGGKLYDPEKPYNKDWTKVKRSAAIKQGVCAIPKSLKWIHEERVLYRSGFFGHKYYLKIPGYGWAIPKDRITKYDRIDLLRYESDKKAMKRGIQKLVPIEIWEYHPVTKGEKGDD